MVPQPKEPEPMQVDQVNYNHHGINNSVPREGTPEYRMAPLDGIVEHTSGRSGKKRRRYADSFENKETMFINTCAFMSTTERSTKDTLQIR